MEHLNCTHFKEKVTFKKAVESLRKKIIKRGDFPHVSIKQQLDLIDKLLTFPLGKFFLERKGADGFWTDYILNHPNANRESSSFSELEQFILKKCPLTIASQERFKIFQREIQKNLREEVIFASIPCGLMRDLITLDYSNLSKFSLLGIDLDKKSISLAKKLAIKHGLEQKTQFIQADAWTLELENQLDLITSSGLNVYVSDNQQLLKLYDNFYKLLKKDGVLIIAVLSYPPEFTDKSEWILDNLPKEDILMEKILYQDILDCKWRNFRTSQEIYREFMDVGFTKVEVIYDTHRIFPTVVATK